MPLSVCMLHASGYSICLCSSKDLAIDDGVHIGHTRRVVNLPSRLRNECDLLGIATLPSGTRVESNDWQFETVVSRVQFWYRCNIFAYLRSSGSFHVRLHIWFNFPSVDSRVHCGHRTEHCLCTMYGPTISSTPAKGFSKFSIVPS